MVSGLTAATSAMSWSWPSGSGVSSDPVDQAKTTAALAFFAAATAAS